MSSEGALVGLDVGDARIGVARADSGATVAFGRGAIDRQGVRRDVDAVAEVVAAEGASTVVVGLPRSMDGSESNQTRRVRDFAFALAERLEPDGVRVVLEDERLSTRSAYRQISRGPLPRSKRQEKGRLDEAAAVIILETYLERSRRST